MDLVSYAGKHNEANGEDNRDGHNENHSWNNGAEGRTDDPEVMRLPPPRRHGLLSTLFATRGTIMLTAGDEAGRSQRGNNNAYCQDNAITWIDWTGAGRGAHRPYRSSVANPRALRRLPRDRLLHRKRRCRMADGSTASPMTIDGLGKPRHRQSGDGACHRRRRTEQASTRLAVAHQPQPRAASLPPADTARRLVASCCLRRGAGLGMIAARSVGFHRRNLMSL